MVLATAITVTSFFHPLVIVLLFYQAAHMPRSLPQLALESLKVSGFTTIKVKSKGAIVLKVIRL
jgi:hypothetical protein